MERVPVNMEFIFRASPTILYKFLTAPDCLIRWFCDEVDVNDGVYTFYWNGAPEEAEIIDSSEDEFIRLHWEQADSEEEYLEYRISKSPVTGETILFITDFADKGDEDDQRQLWESQIKSLQQETGG